MHERRSTAGMAEHEHGLFHLDPVQAWKQKTIQEKADRMERRDDGNRQKQNGEIVAPRQGILLVPRQANHRGVVGEVEMEQHGIGPAMARPSAYRA